MAEDPNLGSILGGVVIWCLGALGMAAVTGLLIAAGLSTFAVILLIFVVFGGLVLKYADR